jgi:hypothetical protein
MEVLPRIKTAPQVGSTLHHPAAHNMSVSEIISKKDDQPQRELDKKEDKKADVKQQSSFFRDNMTVILIFATIIIVLVLIIVWLVSKNSSYFGFFKSKPARAPPSQKIPMRLDDKTRQAMSHNDIIHNASEDELAKFANLDVKKEVFAAPLPQAQKPPAKPPQAPVRPPLPVHPPVPLPPPQALQAYPLPAPPVIVRPPPPQENSPTIVDMDDDLEKSFNAKLDAIEKSSNTEVSPTLAIDEAVDAEVAKVEAEQHKVIEQLNNSGDVVASYNNSEEVYAANFDFDKVQACCRGDAKTYKKYKWRYQTKS